MNYDYDNKRYYHNILIISMLQLYFTKYPEQRFTQGLYNLGIINTDKDYNMESRETLKLLKEKSNKNSV